MDEMKEEGNHEDDRNEHTEDLDILKIVNSIEGGRPAAERLGVHVEVLSVEEIKEERNHKNDRNEHTEDLEILEIVNSIERGLPEAEERLRVRSEGPCTIYQVSKVLLQVNEKCYEPQLVSIGPYHRGKEALKPMEEKKYEYLLGLLSRNPKLKLEDFVKEIKELELNARKCYSECISLKSKEFVEMMVFDGCFLVEIFLRIRHRKLNDELWLPLFISHDMLLLENQLPFFILERIFSLVVLKKRPGLIKDLVLACFDFIYVMPLNEDAAMKESYHHVLDMFHHHCLPKPSESTSESDSDSDSESGSDSDSAVLKADAVIEAQYSAKQGSSRPDPALNQIQTLNIEEQSDPDPNAALLQADTDVEAQSHQDNAKRDPDIEDKSCTNPISNDRWARLASWLGYVRIDRQLWHLIRKCGRRRRRRRKRKRTISDWPFSIRSAEELQEAGIKFERKEMEPAGSFLDVEFDKKGTLKIPCLYFSDDLQTIFQNLIAYEQCYPEAGTFFTGYAMFMDHLINTAKDVRILHHAGILTHGLGSNDELAQHFNEMCRQICFEEDTHLFSERMDINDYCGKRWPTWRAKLMRNYFNSPWAILSLLAAVLLLLLTITQTVFSILPNV